MTNLWIVWLVAGLALLAAEVHQQAFYAVFLAAASFAACVADLAGANLWIQGIIFAVVGFGGIGVVRRPVAQHFQRSDTQLKIPGMYGGFVGQSALAVDEIGDEHHPGHARLGGETYLAITDSSHPLAAQTPLVVSGMRGTTLLVRPAAEASAS